MLKVNPEVAPIYEMFVALVRDAETRKLMQSWQETLSKGQVTFQRQIDLTGGIALVFRIHTNLNPTLDRARGKLVLDPALEFAGIFLRAGVKHKTFTYFENEVLVVKGNGKWDYVGNERFKSLRLNRNLSVSAIKGADGKAPAEELAAQARQVAEVCRHWLVNNQLRRRLEKKAAQEAAAAPVPPGA